MGRGSSKASDGGNGVARPSINPVIRAVGKVSPHDFLSWNTIPRSFNVKGRQFEYMTTSRYFSESRKAGVVTTSYQARDGSREVFTVEVEMKSGEVRYVSPKAFWEQ